MAWDGWGFEMKIRREHVHKTSHPTKVVGMATAATKGPKGPGVPPTSVQMPRRVGAKVRPPSIRKLRGG